MRLNIKHCSVYKFVVYAWRQRCTFNLFRMKIAQVVTMKTIFLDFSFTSCALMSRSLLLMSIWHLLMTFFPAWVCFFRFLLWIRLNNLFGFSFFRPEMEFSPQQDQLWTVLKIAVKVMVNSDIKVIIAMVVIFWKYLLFVILL